MEFLKKQNKKTFNPSAFKQDRLKIVKQFPYPSVSFVPAIWVL